MPNGARCRRAPDAEQRRRHDRHFARCSAFRAVWHSAPFGIWRRLASGALRHLFLRRLSDPLTHMRHRMHPVAITIVAALALYNGNGGVQYNTQTLSGTIVESCSGRGVAVVNYPQDGIQNGSPDGMALVNASGQVIEFLSYEGVFTATDGPAAGTASTDIGVSESSSPIGQSLQRTTAGAWL